jgi:hypothetical protein
MRRFLLVSNLLLLAGYTQEQCIVLSSPTAFSFSTELSFLYLGCGERGLDFAITSGAVRKVQECSFEWSPAFRVLLGGGIPHDHWKLDATYTWFAHQTKKGVHDPEIFAVWTSPSAFSGNNLFARWQDAEARWRIQAHFLDVMLSTSLLNSLALSFRPAFGLRGSLFSQHWGVDYRMGNLVAGMLLENSSIKMVDRSLNVGPSFSLDTSWKVACHWNLVGALTGGLLASHFSVDRNEEDITSLSAEAWHFKDEFWTTRPQAGARFGVMWDLETKAVRVGVTVAYELQIWWKQNMVLRHIDAPTTQGQNLMPVQGDLFFQGATVNLLLDF